MNTSLAVWIRIYLVGLILAAAADASAFKIDTHQKLNNKAAVASNLDIYLKEQLGIADGLEETFKAKKVREWIELGGEAEDEAFSIEFLGAAFRSRQHFHNPLLSWDQAGLNARSLCSLGLPLVGQASVRWAQNSDQGFSGNAAWNDARKSFLQALTLPSKAERDAAFAQTFQILGQQMHLVEDLAAPAHTRNDPHCPSPDGFEDWASRSGEKPSFQSLLAGPPIRPDLSIFTLGVPISDPIAKVPIARLWDTDQYKLPGPTPAVTLSPTIGLAEYSNANFFSDNTIFNKFDFPAPTSVELGPPEPEPRKGELRRYFKKVRDGELINHLAVPSALYESLPEALKDQKKGLDSNVFQDYAAKLLPRAVGYSAALLDYFFRESLQVERMYWESNPWGSGGVFIDIRNQAAEKTEGVFEIHAIYGKGTDGERREKFAALNDGASVKIGPHTSRIFQLDVPLDHRPTPDYVLVFRGRLGNEESAVVGQVFMVPHVIVVQEGYHADLVRDCRRIDQVGMFEPWLGATYSLKTAALRCDWNPVNHTLSGRILTNSRSPIIERIEARWWGRPSSLAPLTIGEQTYAGVWQREGAEPDPERFSIADPASGRVGLNLTIFLKGGEWIETNLATFSRSGSAHAKHLWVHNPGSGGGLGYLVDSGRGVALIVDYNWYNEGLLQYPFFQATSISGYPNPTDTITYRWFSGVGLGEGVVVQEGVFDAGVIDDFKTIPSGESKPSTEDPAYQGATQLFDAIEPLVDPQTHEGPFMIWQAEVARVYQPMEREFLRAVMTTEPPPFTIPLSGTQQ